MKSKRKFKKRTIRTVFALAIMFFMYAGIFSAFANVITLNQEKHILKEKLAEKQDEKVHLEGEVIKLEDEEYVARYARERYLFSKKGEYIIKIQK